MSALLDQIMQADSTRWPAIRANDEKLRALQHYTAQAALAVAQSRDDEREAVRTAIRQAREALAPLMATWDGADEVLDALDAATLAVDEMTVPTAEEISERRAEHYREMCDDDRRAGL